MRSISPWLRGSPSSTPASLALIRDARFDGSESPYSSEVRRILPHARSINHELGKGRYAPMDKDVVARTVNRGALGIVEAHSTSKRQTRGELGVLTGSCKTREAETVSNTARRIATIAVGKTMVPPATRAAGQRMPIVQRLK